MTEHNALLLDLAERYRDLCQELIGDVETLVRENADLRAERETTDVLLGEAWRQLGQPRQRRRG